MDNVEQEPATSDADLSAQLLTAVNALEERLGLFLDLLTEEREAIRTLSVEQLTRINESKLRLIGELSGLDQQRGRLVERLAVLWKVEPSAVTLSMIGDRIGGSVGDKLKRQQDQLRELIAVIRENNEFISSLLTRSLAFLHEALKMWYAPTNTPPLYSGSGMVHSVQPEGGILRRKG
jgi:flagellar biosynthesis/type III secretory pathway chaperone